MLAWLLFADFQRFLQIRWRHQKQRTQRTKETPQRRRRSGRDFQIKIPHSTHGIFFSFFKLIFWLSYFLTQKSLQENQAREKKKVAKEREAKNEERKQNRELAKEGKAPVFMSKTDRKKKDLVDKFEELKSTGKIDQYLKKKAKKNMIKDRKKL